MRNTLQSLLMTAWLASTVTSVGWGEDRFPFRQQPVDYYSDDLQDAVARMQRTLREKPDLLQAESEQGRLQALLSALSVPRESQVLVYSKTSVNLRFITPETPRAIYFNDEVYVGWTPRSPLIEISAMDPRKGAIFYTLRRGESGNSPRIEREESCLLCHASQNSLDVPGHLLRSYLTDPRGNPTQGFSLISPATPIEQRWGGWYVTGHGPQPHLGNLVTERDQELHRSDPSHGGNLQELPDQVRTELYLEPHSDMVALLVLDHQTHVQNLLTRAAYEQQFQRGVEAETRLLKSLLFADAAPLRGPVQGTSGFAKWFQSQGPCDRRGRSLRDLDLQTRLPKYRLSYLIDSAGFRGLPEPLKSRLYRQLWNVLKASGKSSAEIAPLPEEERRAILDILRQTHGGLPEYWKTEGVPQPTGQH